MKLQSLSTTGLARPSAMMLPLAMGLSIGCTTLGPMPATTGMASVPAGRPSVEGSVGIVPGYYLSEAVQPDPTGAALGQAGILVEPDSIIQVPGLVVGGRYVSSSSSGGYPEPMVGYRTYLGDDHALSMSAVGYAAYAHGSHNSASYSATRGGAEAGVDFRVTPEFEWFELHLGAAASLTGISARGRYCVDSDARYGVDCPDPPDQPQYVERSAGGLYPSAVGLVGIDVGRRLNGAFHGARVAVMLGGGTMPRVVADKQEGAQPYSAGGLTLTVGLGGAR
jgi:hypothetical protein